MTLRGSLLLTAAVALVAGIWLGGHPDALPEPLREALVEPRAELSSEVLDVIERKYFEKVPTEALENASAAGMVRALRRRYKDRFSHYFDPESYKRFQVIATGRFSGVGMTVIEVPRGLRVASVFKGTPADEGGIRRRDLILAVDGRSIAGQDSELSTARIQGKAGTEVELTVLTPSSGRRRRLSLKRREIKVPAVESKTLRAGGRPVAYVRLVSFSEGAHAGFRSAVARLKRRGAEGLIVDVRGNGGGLLTEAILTTSVLVEDGPIVSTSGRTQGKRTYEAVGDALPEVPTVVLVNGDTASAAEILAAALSEAGVAKAIGETTFGKGSFQEVIPLEAGGALDLTVGEYLTRSGRSVNHKGLEPDVWAPDRPKTKADETLDRARAVLSSELRD